MTFQMVWDFKPVWVHFGSNVNMLIITPAIDNYEGVKMGCPISHEWCLFLQNWSQCFKIECLVVLIIKKKSGNKATWKY